MQKLINHIADALDRAVIVLGNLYAGAGAGGMNHLSVADVDGHMAAVMDDIAGLHFIRADLTSGTALLAGSTRQADAVLLIDGLNETGAVCTAGQACPAVYIIQIADKRQSIGNDGVANLGIALMRGFLFGLFLSGLSLRLSFLFGTALFGAAVIVGTVVLIGAAVIVVFPSLVVSFLLGFGGVLAALLIGVIFLLGGLFLGRLLLRV